MAESKSESKKINPTAQYNDYLDLSFLRSKESSNQALDQEEGQRLIILLGKLTSDKWDEYAANLTSKPPTEKPGEIKQNSTDSEKLKEHLQGIEKLIDLMRESKPDQQAIELLKPTYNPGNVEWNSLVRIASVLRDQLNPKYKQKLDQHETKDTGEGFGVPLASPHQASSLSSTSTPQQQGATSTQQHLEQKTPSALSPKLPDVVPSQASEKEKIQKEISEIRQLLELLSRSGKLSKEEVEKINLLQEQHKLRVATADDIRSKVQALEAQLIRLSPQPTAIPPAQGPLKVSVSIGNPDPIIQAYVTKYKNPDGKYQEGYAPPKRSGNKVTLDFPSEQ